MSGSHESWLRDEVLKALKKIEQEEKRGAGVEEIRDTIFASTEVFPVGAPFMRTFVALLGERLIAGSGMGGGVIYSLTKKAKEEDK